MSKAKTKFPPTLYRTMNVDANPNPDPDKTARHEALSHLRYSTFVQNEYFSKIRRERRSELRQKNKDVIEPLVSLFCLGQGKDYRVLMNSDT